MTAAVEMNRIDPVMTSPVPVNPTRSIEELIDEAIAYGDAGNFQAAVISLNEAILSSPYDPRLYAMRGGCLAIMGNYDAALADSTHAISLNPDPEVLGLIYLTMAGCYGMRGDMEAGMMYLRLSAELGNEEARELLAEAEAEGIFR